MENIFPSTHYSQGIVIPCAICPSACPSHALAIDKFCKVSWAIQDVKYSVTDETIIIQNAE